MIIWKEDLAGLKVLIDDVSVAESIPTDLNNSFSQQEIRVFPNPASNILNISGLNEPTQITVFDASGITVMKIVAMKTMDISHLGSGFYFVKVGNKVIKFIK